VSNANPGFPVEIKRWEFSADFSVGLLAPINMPNPRKTKRVRNIPLTRKKSPTVLLLPAFDVDAL
jgi:hypothetical protein